MTAAIIRDFHSFSLQGDPDLVLNLIPTKFWIPDEHSTVTKEILKCVTCHQVSIKPLTQIKGNSPPSRVNPCRAFKRARVDFSVPLTKKCTYKRKSTIFKSYIYIFICMCIKSAHVELVSILSTNASIHYCSQILWHFNPPYGVNISSNHILSLSYRWKFIIQACYKFRKKRTKGQFINAQPDILDGGARQCMENKQRETPRACALK